MTGPFAVHVVAERLDHCMLDHEPRPSDKSLYTCTCSATAGERRCMHPSAIEPGPLARSGGPAARGRFDPTACPRPKRRPRATWSRCHGCSAPWRLSRTPCTRPCSRATSRAHRSVRIPEPPAPQASRPLRPAGALRANPPGLWLPAVRGKLGGEKLKPHAPEISGGNRDQNPYPKPGRPGNRPGSSA